MTAAYIAQDWSALFLAAAVATAALSGLIFVGLSVNIRTVLAVGQRDGQNFLTGRALEALAALLIVLVISLIGLVPAIPRGALAAFILVAGFGSATSPVRALARQPERDRGGRPAAAAAGHHGRDDRHPAAGRGHARHRPRRRPVLAARRLRAGHRDRRRQRLGAAGRRCCAERTRRLPVTSRVVPADCARRRAA